jgi:tetratricopeptide (TPR) repeat protein
LGLTSAKSVVKQIQMATDEEKIEQIKEILKTQNFNESFGVIRLAKSIENDIDRDWYLFEAVRWLIKNGGWQEAYDATRSMSEYYEKGDALRIIAEFLLSDGQSEKAFSRFDEAERVALTENLAEWQQAELLHEAAKSLYQLKAIAKADEIWERAIQITQNGENSNPQDSIDSSSVLAQVAVDFAAEDRIEKALSIAKKIKSIRKKERALHLISEYFRNN